MQTFSALSRLLLATNTEGVFTSTCVRRVATLGSLQITQATRISEFRQTRDGERSPCCPAFHLTWWMMDCLGGFFMLSFIAYFVFQFKRLILSFHDAVSQN